METLFGIYQWEIYFWAASMAEWPPPRNEWLRNRWWEYCIGDGRMAFTEIVGLHPGIAR